MVIGAGLHESFDTSPIFDEDEKKAEILNQAIEGRIFAKAQEFMTGDKKIILLVAVQMAAKEVLKKFPEETNKFDDYVEAVIIDMSPERVRGKKSESLKGAEDHEADITDGGWQLNH